MNRKQIFMDVDGTFTVPGGHIPPESAVRAVQKANALLSICVSASENTTLVRPVQLLNALLPMVSVLAARVTDLSCVQRLKASAAMNVTPSGT